MQLLKRRQSPSHNSTDRPAELARGFTLIETVIAMLVIMIALLGLASLFVYGIGYNSAAHVRTIAMALAQQRMERLREGTFDEVVASNETDVESAGYHFTVTTDVVPSGNLRTVTVTVRPKAGSAWARQPVVLVTQRAGTGLGAYFQ
jgi:type IV pilus modification protein PilV